MKNNPQIVQCTNEQYHSSDGLSRSKIWAFKELPFKYYYQYLSGQYEKPAESEAFLIGNAVHTMVLEPNLFDKQYFVMPKVNRTTKQGKADYEEALSVSNGRKLINSEQFDLIYGMSQSVCSNETVSDILKDAKIEQSIYWQHEETGLVCKSRPDVWSGSILADLKTTLNASHRSFQLDAYKSGYFLQAGMIFEAMRQIGARCDKFVFICVEKKPPFALGVYVLDDEAMQFGVDMYNELLIRIKKCQDMNFWPDYGIQKLTIPAYASLENEIEM